jgi:hypothetical protein
LLKRAHVIAGEIRYFGKETNRKPEEGDEINLLEFAAANDKTHTLLASCVMLSAWQKNRSLCQSVQ